MIKQRKIGKHTLYFDDVRHRFWDEHEDGLISVTTVTGIVDKSRPLIFWAVNLAKQYLLDIVENQMVPVTTEHILTAARQHTIKKEEAADIGTEIHKWVSAWIQGQKPEIPDNEKIRQGIDAFLKFQNEYKVKWLQSEEIVGSFKHHFAGIMDAVGKIGKDLVLIDFKSSNAIYPEMYLQVAGYQMAWEEETKKKLAYRIIARFGKDDGEFEYRKLDDKKADAEAFLAALKLKLRMKELTK